MADNLPAIPPETLLVENMDGAFSAVRDPVTGEVVPLSDGPGLADWMLHLKEHRAALSAASAVVQAILIADMDRNARWTYNRPGGSISAPSPTPGVAADQWDGNRLYQTLEDLVKEGMISPSAMADAVEIVTDYKPKAKGIAALLKVPDIAPWIETCRAEAPPEKKRSVTVK